MKPFLGIDVTENKKNTRTDGDEFLVQSLSAAQSDQYDRKVDSAQKSVDRLSLPLPLTILRGLSGVIALATLGGYFKHLGNLSFAQMYANAPHILWILAACILIFLGLTFWERRHAKNLSESPEFQAILQSADDAADENYAALGVPKDAREADILIMYYLIKDGELTPRRATQIRPAWINCIFRVFLADNCLCIADTERRYAIPLSSLRNIRTVNMSILLFNWNKEVSPKEEPYRSYKLKTDDRDHVYVKPYHILEFEHQGETWCLYFPCYELPLFESLTGLNATPLP